MTLPYIVQVALVLTACLVFYKLLLRRETFYRINRYVLMVCLAIAFTLPMLPVPHQFSLRKADKEMVQRSPAPAVNIEDQYVPDSLVTKPITQTPSSQNNTSQSGGSSFSSGHLMNWLFWMYWFGVAIFAGSFLFQIGILLWRAYRNPVIVDGPYRIVEVSGDKAPCSFGNNIFINPEKYDWDTYNQILEHEKVHIRQKHTLDIILAELVLIVQWFNPFAWIYRREIENNLEFLTDDQLMEQKIDKQSYQLSLVKVSAPHFPLSLTTNYNQSILKKRIAMMNAKRSNLHTAWKYFFLLPVLAFLACLMNEPVAYGQDTQKAAKADKPARKHAMQTEGYWFAVIKDDKVHIRFSEEKLEDDENFSNSYNGSTFKLSELGTIPKGTSGSFAINREAGKMEMTGKFDGNTGMGTYKFIADKAYVDHMNKELNEKLRDDEELAFFFINIKKDYLQMLKTEGFTHIEKDELIPMAAMKIDGAYIQSIRESGFKDITMEKLIPFKAMSIDGAYIKDIRDAGYKNITADQLVAFKAQGIDKDYIGKVRQLSGKDENDADDIVSFKAMNIDEAFINSFKAIGYSNIPHDQLVSFKATGVTADYVKGWQNLGYKNIELDDFVGMKTQNVTPEFMKSFIDLGYKDVKPDALVGFKATGVTPEYVKSWQSMGYKDIELDEFVGMKTQNVTPEFMKSFTDMGYKNVKPEDLVAFKALGITTDYVKSWQSLGYKNVDLDQMPALKSLNVTPEYIRSFEAIGYKNIDIDELPGLKSQNITPEFIKSFEAVGFKNIPLDDIIAVKAVGVTPEYIKDMRSKGFNYDKLQKYITLKSID